MAAEAKASPIAHSLDADALHFPGGNAVDLYKDYFLTKFMFLELVAAALLLLGFWFLVGNVRKRGYAKGFLANLMETLVVYVREQIAVPGIGKHDADRFVPLLWSLFFFILVGNLLGMFPWLGSFTGSISATAALALCAFVTIHVSGIREQGPTHYAKSFVPPVPAFILPLLVPIEIFSNLLRPAILAIRLFANMLAGHTVLYVFLSFIAVAGAGVQGGIITTASLTGVVLLSTLELLVAFLQAYVFTFLTALFIGQALHPHH